MKVLRTPDERFASLPGYDFAANYQMVPDGDGGELRIHYLDEGPKDGEIVLCMHGQPSWSYLYRKMLPILTDAGYRVIAPDLVGFGKSDKPAERRDYTYQRHVDWMCAWLLARDLKNITFVGQDWGGLIGLRMLTAHPDRYARAVVANTGLPDAKDIPDEMAGPMRDVYDSIPVIEAHELGEKFAAKDGPPGFFYWRKYTSEHPNFKVRDVMASLSLPEDGAEAILDAYAAPFPDDSYQAGARQFPSLVPIFPDDPSVPANRDAWKVLQSFEKPFLTAFSDRDPVTAGGEKRFQEDVPGAKGQKHVTIKGAGHFLQEESPEDLANAVIGFIKDNPLP